MTDHVYPYPYVVEPVLTDWGLRYVCIDRAGEMLGGGMTFKRRNEALRCAKKYNDRPQTIEILWPIDTRGD